MYEALDLVTRSATAVAEYHATATAESAELNNKHLELKGVHSALKSEKGHFRQTMRMLREKYNILQEKKLKLREFIMQARPSMEVKQAKKKSAERDYRRQNEAVLDLTSRIANARWTIGEAYVRMERKKEIIEHYHVLQRYVDSVLERDDSFESVAEMVRHHASLVSVKQELTVRYETSYAAYQKAKNDFLEYKTSMEREHICLVEKIFQTHRRLTIRENESFRLEELLKELQAGTSYLCLTMGHVKITLREIYHKICAMEKHPPRSENPIIQLKAISRFLGGNFDYLNATAKSKKKTIKVSVDHTADVAVARSRGQSFDMGRLESGRPSVAPERRNTVGFGKTSIFPDI